MKTRIYATPVEGLNHYKHQLNLYSFFNHFNLFNQVYSGLQHFYLSLKQANVKGEMSIVFARLAYVSLKIVQMKVIFTHFEFWSR